MSTGPDPGWRDKKINEIASFAAEEFCKKHTKPSDLSLSESSKANIKDKPEEYLQHTVPYLTVRTLHRHEKALASLEADSKWIKWFAVITGVLTLVLVGLTIALVLLTIVLAIMPFLGTQ